MISTNREKARERERDAQASGCEATVSAGHVFALVSMSRYTFAICADIAMSDTLSPASCVEFPVF
jgi:hypothetical protein